MIGFQGPAVGVQVIDPPPLTQLPTLGQWPAAEVEVADPCQGVMQHRFALAVPAGTFGHHDLRLQPFGVRPDPQVSRQDISARRDSVKDQAGGLIDAMVLREGKKPVCQAQWRHLARKRGELIKKPGPFELMAGFDLDLAIAAGRRAPVPVKLLGDRPAGRIEQRLFG